MKTSNMRPHKAYDFREASQAVRALMEDPNDVAQVFRIVNALPGHSFERVAARMRTTSTGQRLLRERPNLSQILLDHDYLESLPPGSLGRAYLDYARKAGIGADGLIAADEEAGWDEADTATEEIAFVRQWLRDTHDLWHLATGYETDLLGEPALVAFNFVQTWSPGLGFIAAMVFVKGGKQFAGMRRMIIEGLVRGLRSGWLPGEDWVAFLPMPLEEVQRRLRIPKLRPYKPIHLADLPGGKVPPL